MTNERMALLDLVEKDADSDLVRDMLAFAAERMMEAEAEVAAGAAKGARTPLRDATATATARGSGIPVRGGSSWRSPVCARAPCSRAPGPDARQRRR